MKPKLTPMEKVERDERARKFQQHWQNICKMQKVAEAAARAGWYTMSLVDFKQWVGAEYPAIEVDDVLMMSDGNYRLTGIVDGTVYLRRTAEGG